jgi:hypothetical protein
MQSYKVGCGYVVTSPITCLPCLMAPKYATTGKKKPAKALKLKEAVEKEVTAKLSARKAATGKRATRGKENPHFVAAHTSVASSTSVRHTRTGMAPLASHRCHMLLTGLAGVTVPTPATSKADQDLTLVATDTVATLSTSGDSQHAEVTMLCGKYFDFFACILLLKNSPFPFSFLAQLAVVTRELKAAQEAAASRSTEHPQVPRLKTIKNLQEAMGLKDDSGKYRLFCISPFF